MRSGAGGFFLTSSSTELPAQHELVFRWQQQWACVLHACGAGRVKKHGDGTVEVSWRVLQKACGNAQEFFR